MDKNVVTCPHCKDPIVIQYINCGIFRHGTYRQSGKQVKPHLNQTIPDYVLHRLSVSFRLRLQESFQSACEYLFKKI